MRITFEDKDYTYVVLTKSITRETQLIRIHLNGEEYELARNEKGDWDAADATISDHQGLLSAIARNIKLRYRLH